MQREVAARPGATARGAALELLVVAAAAFAVRAWIVVSSWGDRGWVHDGAEYANLGQRLVRGVGFTSPWPEVRLGLRKQTAVHAPAASIWSALGNALGFDSNQSMRLWFALLGTATVVLVAFVAYRWFGRWAGRVAGLVGAVYPNFWQNDMLIMNEVPGQFLTAVVVLTGLRYARSPSAAGAGMFGGACALAALARPEMVLATAAIPVVAWRRAPDRSAAVRHVATAALWAVVALAPWVGWNMYRFERPVVMTTGVDLTLAHTNCPETYYGPKTGSWSSRCEHPVTLQPATDERDESLTAQRWRRLGLDYVSEHRDRVPAVVAQRLGRSLGITSVENQLGLERAEGRSSTGLAVGRWMYLGLVVAAVPGVVIAKRRRLPLAVLAAPVVACLIGIATSRGGYRFRAPAEIPLVLLASYAVGRAIEILPSHRAWAVFTPSARRGPNVARA